MIEQALHVLMLHILWKTKGLTADKEPTPEEIRYKEVLVEQRETFLEKLVEYAVGTQSNTVDGVKRAVRLILLLALAGRHSSLVLPARPSSIFSICTFCSRLQMPSRRRALHSPFLPSPSRWMTKFNTDVLGTFRPRLNAMLNFWMTRMTKMMTPRKAMPKAATGRTRTTRTRTRLRKQSARRSRRKQRTKVCSA